MLLRYDQRLHWWDVDPRTHPFDAERATEQVDRVVAGGRGADRDAFLATLDRTVVAACGVWAEHGSPGGSRCAATARSIRTRVHA